MARRAAAAAASGSGSGSAATPAGTTPIIFAFDVQCPYAYMAANRVARMQSAGVARFRWSPVLLGGLYRLTDAPQGKDGSATDVMSPAKQRVTALDTARQAKRHGVPLVFNSKHPVRSVEAMRLICSAPDDLVQDVALRLYRCYWQDDEDVSDRAVLRKVADEFGLDLSAIDTEPVKQRLKDNTQVAFERGSFGVPSFWVDGDAGGYPREGETGRLFWGQDRLHFALHAAGVAKDLCGPARLVKYDPASAAARAKPRLTFYHDFASPWSYLAATQVERVAAECGATVEWRPILLGALFRSIGTHNTPALTMSPAKREYGTRDHNDYCRWWDQRFTFTSHFPVRTVAPLRVSIVDPRTIPCLYEATWVNDENVGDPEVLVKVLDRAGFDGAALLEATNDAGVKEQLKLNTQAAMDAGACGVPSFQVNGAGPLIWGQDRLATVQDMLCGWDASVDGDDAAGAGGRSKL